MNVNSHNTKLTILGYDISISKIQPDYDNNINNINIINNIKTDLTILPKICPGYGDDIQEPYILYKEFDSYIRVPIFYGIKKFGLPIIHINEKIISTNMLFTSILPLRDYQADIIDIYMKSISGKTSGGGIISIGCGRGKTVMALNIACKLNLKTLILVHKEFLANQWKERALQFIPNVRIGIIQGKIFDVQDKDLVIGMIQSLSDTRKDSDFPIEIFKQFGLVIADECHHLGARQFSRVLQKWCIPFTLGLSATPKRADNCEVIFHHYLGDFIYKDNIINKIDSPDAIIRRYEYRYNNMAYCREVKNYKGRPNIITMESNITKCIKRTKFIINYILNDLIDEGRTILILSSRLEHINIIKTLLEENIIQKKSVGEWNNTSIGLYLGGMKQRDLDISATRQILIATYIMAEEAFDCPSLNTLIMMTPKKNIEQAIGRIMRKTKEDRIIMPLIIDIVDMFSSFIKWNVIRKRLYAKKCYIIENFEINDDGNTPIIKNINNNTDNSIILDNNIENDNEIIEYDWD